MPDPFISHRRRRPRWRSAWVAGGIGLLALGGLAAYLVLKRPGDVSNPDVPFEVATQPPPRRVPPRAGVDWPVYGYTKARTRHLPVRGLRPPFRRVWSFNGRVLLEFSPIIARDTLFVTRNSGGLFAVNANTGHLRWKRSIGYKAAASAAYARGRVYAVSLHPPRIVALRATSGRTIWQKRLPGRSESSPGVDRGKVYFGCECGLVYALDARTGETIWTTRLAGAVKAAPALYKGALYVGDYGGRMWALRTRDGGVKWSSGSRGRGLGRAGNFYSTPAVAFGRVYAGNTDSRVYSYSIHDGRLAWTRSTGGFVYAAPAVADTALTPPSVYIGSYDGYLYALDARTGGVRWRHRAGGRISGAASVIGEVVYFSNLAAHSTRGLSTRTGRRVFQIGRGAFNPVIADGRRLYLTGYSSLYALAPKRARRAPGRGGATKRRPQAGAGS